MQACFQSLSAPCRVGSAWWKKVRKVDEGRASDKRILKIDKGKDGDGFITR